VLVAAAWWYARSQADPPRATAAAIWAAAGAAAAGVWIIAHYGGRAARWLASASTVLALLLAFARVYVGAHYPGDAAAGLLIGAAISVLGWLAVKPILTIAVERIAQQERLRTLVYSRPTDIAGCNDTGPTGRSATSAPRAAPRQG
jgi:membrane-associated phospholipid phosphatase